MTTPDVLRSLYHEFYKNDDIRREIIKNPNTPATILQNADETDALWILENPAIALHLMIDGNFFHNFRVRLLEKIADSSVDSALLTHLCHIAVDKDLYNLLKIVTRNRALPDAVMIPFASHHRPTIRHIVAMARASLPILSLLSPLCGDPFLQSDTVNPNSRFTDDEWSTLCHAGIWAQRLLSRHPKVPVWVLERLSQETDTSLRLSLCKNPQTPSHILSSIYEASLQMRMYGIERAFLGNTHTPRDIVVKIAQTFQKPNKDDDLSLIHLLLSHTACPSSVLVAWAFDAAIPSPVRARAVANPSFPTEHLLVMVHHRESTLRAAAAQNPQLPSELLATLVQDHHEFVRKEARNAQLSRRKRPHQKNHK